MRHVLVLLVLAACAAETSTEPGENCPTDWRRVYRWVDSDQFVQPVPETPEAETELDGATTPEPLSCGYVGDFPGCYGACTGGLADTLVVRWRCDGKPEETEEDPAQRVVVLEPCAKSSGS